MNRRVFLSGLAGLATGVAGCGGDSASDPDPTPSPVASFAPSPVGVGIYRATEIPPVTVSQFYPHYVLTEGAIYGRSNSRGPGILTNGSVFTAFEFVSPVSNAPVSLAGYDLKDFIVGASGNAFLSFNPYFNAPASDLPFRILYDATTKKTRLVQFDGEPPRVVAINSRKEIFGYKSVDIGELFGKYVEGADGLWHRDESWDRPDFSPWVQDKYLLAIAAERGIFPGSLVLTNRFPWGYSQSNRKPAVYRDGVVIELPEPFPGADCVAEASLPDGSVVGGSPGAVLWRDGSIIKLYENTGLPADGRIVYAGLETVTEDGWVVYTVSGQGYMLTNGTERYPLVVYHSDGKSRPPHQIEAPLSGRRLLAVVGTAPPDPEKRIILTPTW